MAKIPSLSLRFSFEGSRLQKAKFLYLVDLKSLSALAENRKLIFGNRRKPDGRSIRQMRPLFNGNDWKKCRTGRPTCPELINNSELYRTAWTRDFMLSGQNSRTGCPPPVKRKAQVAFCSAQSFRTSTVVMGKPAPWSSLRSLVFATNRRTTSLKGRCALRTACEKRSFL